jgi:hypothetical protein
MTGREISGWAIGWTWFAAVMMWIVGAWQAIAGLVAIVDDTFYTVTPNYIFQFDTTTWGWVHLILGVVVFFGGVGLLSGQVWARTVAVIMAVLGMLVNFAWLPWYPFWSITMIVVYGFVIWALTVHGRDIEYARSA